MPKDDSESDSPPQLIAGNPSAIPRPESAGSMLDERGGGGGGGGGARREEDDADDELRACAALGLAAAGGATLDAQTNRAADRAARASYELQRRFDAACVRASAVSLHPGAVHAHSRRASGDSSAAAVQTPKGVYGTLTGRRVVGPGGPRSAGGHAHFSPS